MAKAPPLVATGETMKLKLAVPVEDKGVVIGEVTVQEPELRHQIAAERTSSQTEQAIRLISQLTGLPESVARRLKFRDAARIRGWVGGLMDSIEPLDCDPLLEGGPKTFQLLVPIDGGKPINEITIQEPDIEAGIAVEKFKHQHEQDAAMIAALSGLTIPVVSRLKMRDVARIKAWLLPFVTDTGLTEEAGAT